SPVREIRGRVKAVRPRDPTDAEDRAPIRSQNDIVLLDAKHEVEDLAPSFPDRLRSGRILLREKVLKLISGFLAFLKVREVSHSRPPDRHAVPIPHLRPMVSGNLAVARADTPVPVRAPVDGVEHLHHVAHRDSKLARSGDEAPSTKIPPLPVRGLLEQLQDVKSLIRQVVQVIEFIGTDQVEILVAPREVANIGGV